MKKSKTRIFIKENISSNLIIYIKNKQHHFLKNVLRVKINDQINIFDGKTGEWKALVTSVNRDNIAIRIIENINIFEPSEDIWLVFAPFKQHRMSLAIQKATELGVSKLIPCFTEYTNNQKINANNLYNNAIEAAEQCERLDVPKVEKSVSLNELLSGWSDERYLIFCDEKKRNEKFVNEKLSTLKKSNNKFAVLTGPEGGFSENEKKLLTSKKFVIPVSLGKRVLRSDTAITVSLFCIQELLT
tara:strand:+ start:1429 stop:2160 length:732 start_codon:yes stop_codon:yes gene_type:complete